jgi:chaperonin GroEL
LVRALPVLENIKLEEDENTGLNILKRALEAPIRQIAENAGLDGAVVVEEIKKHEGAYGFNAQSQKYEDLFTAGVIDPKKVVRTALENAASAASMLLTTEAVVAELPEEDKKKQMPGIPEGY